MRRPPCGPPSPQSRPRRGISVGARRGAAAGADIIVNTDADGQYHADDIRAIVAPVAAGQADIVIGDRGVGENQHFHPAKRLLQRFGSFVVRSLSRTTVTDAVSGFRAISREAAQRITITTEFSYTTDMLIQGGRKRMAIASVPIRTNRTERPSRLFRSIPQFIANTMITILRAYATYNPLRTFAALGCIISLVGAVPIVRFLWFWLHGDGDGHIQSLVLGGALLILGTLTVIMSLLADMIGTNRKLIEITLAHVRRLEETGRDNTQGGQRLDRLRQRLSRKGFGPTRLSPQPSEHRKIELLRPLSPPAPSRRGRHWWLGRSCALHRLTLARSGERKDNPVWPGITASRHPGTSFEMAAGRLSAASRITRGIPSLRDGSKIMTCAFLSQERTSS